MQIAICPSAHGFGHTSRQLALGAALLKKGHQVHFFSHIPHFVQQYLPKATITQASFDVGLYQPNPIHIDIQKTLLFLNQRCSTQQIDRIAFMLRNFDLVIADIPAIVLEACRQQNIACIAISNFDWSWIYAQFPELQFWSQKMARWQQHHTALHIQPGPPLTHFNSVRSISPLVREHESHQVPNKQILLAFGGFESQQLIESLPRLPNIQYLLTPPNRPCNRSDIDYCDNTPYQRLISGCWAILGKPGYGLITEAAQAGTPLILIPRTIFPESEYLKSFSKKHGQIWLQHSPKEKSFASELIHSIKTIEKRGRKTPSHFSGTQEVLDYLTLQYLLP